MGRIRTKDIKDLSRSLQDVYPDRFSPDFEENKKVIADLNIMPHKSKRFRNKVAGYVVRLSRQVAEGKSTLGEHETEPIESDAGIEELAKEIEAEEAAEIKDEPEKKEETKSKKEEIKEAEKTE